MIVLMGFWDKVGGFFKKAGKSLADAIVSFVKSDAARAILQSTEGAIVNAIVTAMAGQNYTSLTSADKREMAVKQATSEIKAAGLDARDSFIRLAIETAVANLKNLGPK